MVQEIWNKFNANERMAAIGAIIVLISFLVGIAVGYGLGTSTIALLGAIAVIAIYYLKYSPNQSINWPAPIPTIVLVIAGISALLALLNVVSFLRFLDGLEWLAAIGTVAGTLMMAWFAWQEYQAQPKTTPPSTPNPPAPPSNNPPA
jgi:hypothetical protein